VQADAACVKYNQLFKDSNFERESLKSEIKILMRQNEHLNEALS